MARKALIRTSDGLVVNVILLEDGAGWSPPDGCYVQDALDASPGDTWDGFKYVKAAPPIRETAPEPPIVAVMDAVLKARGQGLSAAEKDAIQKALTPGA